MRGRGNVVKKERRSSEAEYKAKPIERLRRSAVEKPSVADFASAQVRLTSRPAESTSYFKYTVLLAQRPEYYRPC
jgi:hypothetical protein